MAAVSAWGKPGASLAKPVPSWADDAEANEDALLEQRNNDIKGNGNEAAAAVPIADFPSLAAAKTKTKKKKPQAVPLHEFTKAAETKFEVKKLTYDEASALPTGPRERTAEELERGGGGFRSYGVRGDEQPRRQGSFNREGRESGFSSSRADEIDDWGAGKKSVGGGGGGFERRGERGERGGFFSDSQSRADDVDNWGAKKSFVPSEPRRSDRRVGFGLESNGGADSGNWLKRKEEDGPRRMGGAFDSLGERRESLGERRGGGFESNGADGESWGRKREEVVSVGGGGGGGVRPRLNLQPRTKPVGDEEKGEVKPKGSNPFGAARPREEVLKEKGQDWKELDEKLESAKIKDVSDSPVAAKRGFWGSNGRDRAQPSERAWRKPESGGSRPQSAAGSENGHAENGENGHAKNGENGHAENGENGHADNTENGHAEDVQA